MKTSHFLTFGIGSGIFATGLYFGLSDEQKDIPQSLYEKPKAEEIVSKKKKDIGKILSEVTEQGEKPIQSISSERDRLIELVDKNPALKLRIQGMSWYRDFISGKYTVNDIRKHIDDALLLEEAIRSDGSMLIRMQYGDTWRKYLSGYIPPGNIIYGEIPAILSIDEFSRKNPDAFARIQKNPMFQKTLDDQGLTFSEQKNVIEGILAQEKIIQDNPNIRKKFEQYGYTLPTIYSDDWREGRQSGFFAINDAIYTLEDPKQFDAEVWNQFQNSEIGTQYRAGTIDPRVAMKYINDIAIKIRQ